MARWRDGGRAWERLARWYARWGQVSPDDDDPLGALADIGAGRRLLDEAEMEAVRAARQQGRSWAEIATKLGVTRQSAWERWRDLDEAPQASEQRTVVERGAAAVARRAWVTVPDVIGMAFLDARVRLADVGLDGIPAEPNPLARGTVVDQSPESGARAARGSVVRLFTRDDGDAGVREPRRPGPTPLTGAKMLDEPTADAVE